MTQPDPFELFALRYGTHTGRSDADNFDDGDPDAAGSDLDYYIWVARRGDRVFVIDTGFSDAQARPRGRRLLCAPADGLAAIGIDAARLEDVVMTHLHYDHAGGLEAFPNARLHLQHTEMAHVTGPAVSHPPPHGAYDGDDIVHVVQQLYAGRIMFHDGDVQLDPGLTLHLTGGHSAGLQAVRVFTQRGWVVIAGDAAHLYAHLHDNRVFPVYHDRDTTLDGYRRIIALAEGPDRIIPGHDPLVARLYPEFASPRDGKFVRLDKSPFDTPV